MKASAAGGVALPEFYDYQWGAGYTGTDAARFRLWAPTQKAVSVEIGGRRHPMARVDDGWFEAHVADVPYRAAYAFVLDNGRLVADPASRQQQEDVAGPSILYDQFAYRWRTNGWIGRPWPEAVIYEIHIGTFTAEGTFNAAATRLEHLADIGITAIEIMPIAHFPGTRGWGYDGVLQYAPHSAYGTPDDLKAFVDAAHALDLMVFLDVVYNHFGPQGNFLPEYAPAFFRKEQTPWGPAIAFERDPVRRYFLDNVIYWLSEFRLDGLRLDAIDQIEDSTTPHILKQISDTVAARFADRAVHLVTENPANGTDLLAPKADGTRAYTADWNDDFHHAMHVAMTGEKSGYYAPFGERPWMKLNHTLADGYLKPGKTIIAAEAPASETLSPTSFVHFLQNHDQVGNRAIGERLHTTMGEREYQIWMAILLLSPQIPLLFMGDEYKETQRFHFFADYTGELAQAILEGRAGEAENFGGIPAGFSVDDLSDPNSIETFQNSKLDPKHAETPVAKAWQDYVRSLLQTRRAEIWPLLQGSEGRAGRVLSDVEGIVAVNWTLAGSVLMLRANFTQDDYPDEREGRIIFQINSRSDTLELAPLSMRLSIVPAPA